MDGDIQALHVELDPNGSLATTYFSQGSEMGLLGGLLGWEAYDERLPDYQRYILEAGIAVILDIVDINASHPNTYKLALKNANETREVTALSVGGGMIEMIEIEEAVVSVKGDYCETLVFVSELANVIEFVEQAFDYDEIEIHQGKKQFIEIKSQQCPHEELLLQLLAMDGVISAKLLRPVLPILTRKNLEVPFITCTEMLEFNADKGLSLWELAVEYESARGDISSDDVYARMEEIVGIMQASIEQGLQGTEYADRILVTHPQTATNLQTSSSKWQAEGLWMEMS